MPDSIITLNFNYEDLGKEGYLVFTFDDERIIGHQMYQDYFPVVWRVVRLNPEGIRRFPEKFNRKYLLTTCHTQSGIVTVDSAIVPINFGESTNLTGDDDQGYNWSNPKLVAGKKNVIQAHNATSKVQDISFCCQSTSTSFVVPEPLLYFPDVGALKTLNVEFTGRLRIYSVTQVPLKWPIFAGDILMPDYIEKIQITSPKIWDHSLDEQNLSNEWIITCNKVTGNFEINAAK